MTYFINTKMDTNSLQAVYIPKQKWNITNEFFAGLHKPIPLTTSRQKELTTFFLSQISINMLIILSDI